MQKTVCILFLLGCATLVQAKTHIPDSVMHRDGLYVDNLKIYPDSAIFQGATLKLDIFNTCYYLARSKAQMQTYEMVLNFRLKQRFYPTLELGYAQGQMGVNEAYWAGRGGWTTIGVDINGLKKHREALDALLVGIRVGTAVQHYDLKNITVDDSYWQEYPTLDFNNLWRNDWWGEVVAGCQVHIYSGLMMGWDIRLKVLFTRKLNDGEPNPYYIPGYGYWKNSQWGFNYYVGWNF